MATNVELLTISALEEHVPKEWISFKDILAGIKESVGKMCVAESPFWLVTNKEDQERLITVVALHEVRKAKGEELAQWVLKTIQIIGGEDISDLPKVVAECPDKSILPLG
jgi:hypothetical protein